MTTVTSEAPVNGVVEGTARRRVAAAGVVLVSMYGPMFAWMLFMPETWSDHRWSVLGIMPILPGLVPGAMVADAFGKSETSALLLASGFTLLMLLIFWHLASIGRRCRLVVGVLVFLASSIHAFLMIASRA